MNETFENPLDDSEYAKRPVSRSDDIRGPFFRDQTAIIHSMPFRRLKHKAQVFFSPNNDHVCTRIEHSLHVASIAATICKGLGLRDEVAFAIGLAHDLGHAPFGHAGETALRSKAHTIGGFIHELHGLRVVDKLGNSGTSLNLTYIVRDGIVCHCGEQPDQELTPRTDWLDLSAIAKKGTIPCSYEGCVVRMADKVAYLGRDLEDALQGGFVNRRDIPEKVRAELGLTNGEIINTLVLDIIETSRQRKKIAISDARFEVVQDLYSFSVDKIYRHEAIQRYATYCERIIGQLFEYLVDIYDRWDSDYRRYESSAVRLDNRFGRYLAKMQAALYEEEKASAYAIVRDYIAGMTDSYALRCMQEISLPEELQFEGRLDPA